MSTLWPSAVPIWPTWPKPPPHVPQCSAPVRPHASAARTVSTPTVRDDVPSRPHPRFLPHPDSARAPKLPHPDHHSGPDHAPKFPCASTLTPKADRVHLRFDRGSRRPDHVHTKEISHRDSVDVAHVLPMLPTCPYPLREATPRQIFSLPIAMVSLRISLMPLLRHAALEAAGVSCTETQVPKRLPVSATPSSTPGQLHCVAKAVPPRRAAKSSRRRAAPVHLRSHLHHCELPTTP
jgi:hypothetical protein